jgi:hypothetical protein
VYALPLPPSTASFAAQYPDSVIDEAVKGSYQMHAIQDQVSDFYYSDNGRYLFTSSSPYDGVTPNVFMSASLFDSTFGNPYDPPNVRGDFDIVGSYFVGLSPQSVLTVRYRVLLSTVPASSDTYLSSLSRMSPPANPDLDTLISLIQSDFLPGIPAGMNPKGEWWKTILRSTGSAVLRLSKPGLKLALDQFGGALSSAVPQLAPVIRPATRAANDLIDIGFREAQRALTDATSKKKNKKKKAVMAQRQTVPQIKQ